MNAGSDAAYKASLTLVVRFYFFRAPGALGSKKPQVFT